MERCQKELRDKRIIGVGSAANYSLVNKVGRLTGIPKGGEVRVGRWMSENEYNIMKKT